MSNLRAFRKYEKNVSGKKVFLGIDGKNLTKDNLSETLNVQVCLRAFVSSPVLDGKYSPLTCLYISNI